MPTIVTRFFRLDPVRRRLLVDAAVALTCASLLLAILPFRKAIRFGSLPLGPNAALAANCVWAIEAVARRVPWRTVCIQKGLALQRLLRRHGHDGRLHYGIGKAEREGDLRAHVWVTLDGHALMGGAEAEGFAPVAVYP